jgi:uncharacterized membrane protein
VPFCTNCGTNVDHAPFCPNCGSRQATGGGSSQYRPTPVNADFLGNLSSRTASILCYIPIFGVIPAIVFLASLRFRTNSRVRFDGFQSLYLFVAWLIFSSAAPTLLLSGVGSFGLERALLGLLKLGILICWVYLLINAAQERQIRLPVIGDLAARSATEQL